ncbi:MAG: transposase [Hymenobacter sp.]|nr:transposase [Hymenobacter sp.]
MMTCTLDLYTDYLLSSTGPTTATGLLRLVDGALSHDHITRWLRNATYGSAQVWRQAKALIRQAEAQRSADEFAVLIVDDSVLEKAHTDTNELICTHWDHSQQRYVKGLTFVSLLYQAGELALPIAVELVRKTVPVWDAKSQQTKYQSPFTKNEYLHQMLRVAQQQVAYRYLLADSWYASAENMTLVRALGHHFIFALESSRTVALSEAARAAGQFQAVQTLVFPDTQPVRVYLRSVKDAVLVTRQVFTHQDGRQGILYLVSSDTDLDQAQRTTIYQRRWKVEEYHKSLKQNASMGQSPAKTLSPQTTHFFAAVLAYTKLEVLKLKCGLGHFRLKAQLYSVGLKAIYQQLVQLRA